MLGTVVSVWILVGLADRLDAMAREQHVTRSVLMRDALEVLAKVDKPDVLAQNHGHDRSDDDLSIRKLQLGIGS